jgi:hypothetical protein
MVRNTYLKLLYKSYLEFTIFISEDGQLIETCRGSTFTVIQNSVKMLYNTSLLTEP